MNLCSQSLLGCSLRHAFCGFGRGVRVFVLFCTLLFSGMSAVMAQEKLLTVDLAQDHVDITTGFNGAYLTLFGTQEQEGDIAIVITGPQRDLVVRKKKRVLGVWANTQSMRFEGVPGFYDYSLGGDEVELASLDVLNEAGIGLLSLQFMPKKDYKNPEKLKDFQDALVRNMQAKQMFPKEPGKIEFLNDHFFRTMLYLPSDVPIGMYTVQVFLLREGAVVDVVSTMVKVAQVGVNARIYRFAQGNSLAYGVLCVLFAMMVGWLSNAVRRRS